MTRLKRNFIALCALVFLPSTALADQLLYTAVASDGFGGYGACWSQPSLGSASNCAARECERATGGRCDVFLTCENFVGNYGAIARSADGSLGAVCGYDRQGQAASEAVDQCAAAAARGNRNTCEVTELWYETY